MSHEERQDQGGHGVVDDEASGHGRDVVTIQVNGADVPIHRGRRTVAEIKEKGGVGQADVLAQVIDGKLTDLPDTGSVTIKGGEEFHSHPRDSGSSHG